MLKMGGVVAILLLKIGNIQKLCFTLPPQHLADVSAVVIYRSTRIAL